MSFSPKQKSLAILPKPFAILSLIGSTYIAYHVLKDPKRRRSVQYQILLGLSFSDIMFSICVFLGTWPIPASVNDVKPTVFLASGNDRICDAHGFFVQATIMTPIYNAGLSLYYVLVVKLGWTESKIKKVWWVFHVLPLAIGFGTAAAGSALHLYGNATLWCWISPSSGDPNWNIYRWAIYYGILWFVAFAVIIPSMVLVYLHVRKQEAAVAKYNPGSSQAEQFKRSRKVAMQGIFFCLSFIITWVFPTLTRLMQAINGVTYYPLIVLMTIFLPLQGFFNACVFLRPKYLKYREDNPQAMGTFVRSVVRGGDVPRVTMFRSSRSRASQLSSSEAVGDDSMIIKETRENNIDKLNEDLNNAKDLEEDTTPKRKSIQWAAENDDEEEHNEA